MALVALLRGVNVGGHRTFRPSVLARQLARFDVVNVGAAGTFVIREPVSRTRLRSEILRRLPFEAHVMICDGRDILRLTSVDPFVSQPAGRDIVRFVSLLARQTPLPRVPIALPSGADWSVKVIACQDRFVLGLYRRQMRTIGYLGQLDKTFGVPMSTRNWSTILAIAGVLREGPAALLRNDRNRNTG